jgi:voltage-gated potassium channel
LKTNIPSITAAIKRRESREFRFSILAIASLLIIGTTGFSLIEGWRVFDSFYMTVVTLSTVGFQEVHPLSDLGREFAIILIFMGVGVATAVLPRLAGHILERQMLWIFKHGDDQRMIDKLTNHTILCGYGKLCQVVARELKEAKVDFVVIDREEALAEEARQGGFLVVKGDATTDATLLAAGIKQASRLVALMPSHSDNVYTIMSARELNPNLFVMSRAEDENGERRLLRAGANRIISPYRLGGQKVASGLLKPYVTEFLDLAADKSGSGLCIEELKISEGSPLAGATLEKSELRQKTNIMIAALISKGGSMTVNPTGETVIEAGDTLIGLGRKRDFAALEKLVISPN